MTTDDPKFAIDAQEDLCSLGSVSGLDLHPVKRAAARGACDGQLHAPFVLGKRSYARQYAGIYFCRLAGLRQFVLDSCSRKWGEAAYPFVEKILGTTPGQVCIVMGTVYTNAKLKPSVLDDIGLEHSITSVPPPPKYYTADDVIALEDESGRVVLCGDFVKSEIFITGSVLAVLGREDADGNFEVLDMCLPGLSPQTAGPPPAMSNGADGDARYVALVSGCSVGSTDSSAGMQLLCDYLTGALSSNSKDVDGILRVIFAGNTLAEPVRLDGDGQPRRFGQENKTYDQTPILLLDNYLDDLCQSVHCDVMAGAHDPTNSALPQQPMHKAMFPRSNQLSTFNTVTNPYRLRLDGIE